MWELFGNIKKTTYLCSVKITILTIRVTFPRRVKSFKILPWSKTTPTLLHF